MKLFDIDWIDFVNRLSAWDRLSRNARVVLSQTRSDQPAQAARLGEEAALAVEAGFLEYLSAAHRHLKWRPECMPFARVIGALIRHDILATSDSNAMEAYVKEHFTEGEIRPILPGHVPYYLSMFQVARQATSVDWLDRFFEEPPDTNPRPASDYRSHASAFDRRGIPSWLAPPPSPKPAVAERPETISATRVALRRFMTWPEAVPMGELRTRFADLSNDVLAGVIDTAVRKLLLFPAMRMHDMTPVLGLWPTIAARLHRPKPSVPPEIEPEQKFEGAFLMEDMTTVLVAGAAEPLRIRGNDGALFTKVRERLEENLVALPEWIVELIGWTRAHRLAVALDALTAMRLIRRRGESGKDLRLEPAPLARDWLSGSAKERLKSIFDFLNPLEKEPLPKDRRRRSPPAAASGPFVFLPPGTRIQLNAEIYAGICEAITAACASLPEGRFLSFLKFIAWRREVDNPLVRMSRKNPSRVRVDWSYDAPSTEELETAWANVLVAFGYLRLGPLAGVQLGVHGGALCIAMAAPGRYFLRMAEDFDYGLHVDRQTSIIVQPNFDVVFLAPSPMAEAELARIAERAAKGTGAVFKITKKSIVAAAAAGLMAEGVQATLQRISSKPVPANVAREIQGWFDQCRRVSLTPRLIIRCPDETTAARVLATAGAEAEAISPTVLGWAERTMPKELIRKLRSMGIFVDRG